VALIKEEKYIPRERILAEMGKPRRDYGRGFLRGGRGSELALGL